MGLLSGFTRHFRRQLAAANAPLRELAERQLVLQALLEAKANRARQKVSGLFEVEFCAFSQWGEDGILDWLVERLGDVPPVFIEFGVEDYREANTGLLLQLRNWRGLVLDGSLRHINNIKRQNIYWRHNIEAKHAFIDSGNINQLISEAGLSGEIGIMSIDIDGNDYWVWDKIAVVDPVIVVCEYNAVFGDKYALTVPYRADFQRTKAHHSNLYFGASLPAMIAMGSDKGYTFVGTTSTGCNAFFIRNDRSQEIIHALEGAWAFPSSAREARDASGNLTFVSGLERPKVTAQMPVVDLDISAQELVTLESKGDLYSKEWRAGLGVAR
jgi:hypothetical protein